MVAGDHSIDHPIDVPRGPRTLAYSLSPQTIRTMYRHAGDCYPKECCGFLQHQRDAEDQLIVCENVQDKLHNLDAIAHPRTAETAYSLGGG